MSDSDDLARCSMKPLRTLLVDDEPNARTRLRRLLQNEERVEIIGEASDGLEAVAEIERLRPDLIFLDIQMPGLDGFEVLRALPAGLPQPLIIFVTGFHEHAMAALDANAIAYLLKPIEPERLREMLERAWRIHHFGEDRTQSATPSNQATASFQPGVSQLVARKHERLLFIDPADVLYFYVYHGVVGGHMVDQLVFGIHPLMHLDGGLTEF